MKFGKIDLLIDSKHSKYDVLDVFYVSVNQRFLAKYLLFKDRQLNKKLCKIKLL